MDLLVNPQDSLPCIHIAGTNGKGSTATMIASVTKEAGYKTGLFTSPFIYDFKERFAIDGNLISEEQLLDGIDSFLLFAKKLPLLAMH